MSAVRSAALLVAVALVVAGCAGEQTEATPESTTTASSSAEAAELDESVAAVVAGDEIPAARIDEQLDALADSSELSEQLGDERGRSVFRAQILSTTIINRVVVEAAKELEVPVSDDEVAEARGALEEQAGGAEALSSSIDEQGLTEDQVDEQLRGYAALQNVQSALADEAGEDPPGEEATGEQTPGSGSSLSPAEQRAQQYLRELMSTIEVVVNDDYGTWDPQAGQVTPVGGFPTTTVPGGAGSAPAPSAPASSAPGDGADGG